MTEFCEWNIPISLQWRHNEHDSVSNHQPHDCLHNRLFGRRSKKTSKLRVTGLCAGNSPETGEFPAQRASNAENVSIWWRHHVNGIYLDYLSGGKILYDINQHCFLQWFSAKKTPNHCLNREWHCPPLHNDTISLSVWSRYKYILIRFV